MPAALLATALVALSLGQTLEWYGGTWIAELAGTTYVRLELRVSNGALGGQIGLGDIEVDSKGDVRTAAAAPRVLTPIFDVVVTQPYLAARSTSVARGESILSFSRKDGDDTDHFELKLAGDQAALSFLLTDADRRELAEIGGGVPKPFRLKRIAP